MYGLAGTRAGKISRYFVKGEPDLSNGYDILLGMEDGYRTAS